MRALAGFALAIFCALPANAKPQINAPPGDHAEQAVACYFGLGRKQHYYQACRHARQASHEPRARLIEALCVGRGRGAAQDAAKALRLLQPLLAKGDPLAHAAAALIMGHAQPVEARFPEIFAQGFRAELEEAPTYELSERQRHAQIALRELEVPARDDAVAALLSGQLLNSGLGAPRDEVKAARLYERAWELGSSDGANQLGNLLHDGELARRDAAQSRAWYEKAAEAGNAVALVNLTLDHDPASTDAARIAEYKARLIAACEAGVPSAHARLGFALAHGRGLAADTAEARRWLEKGVAFGERDCFAHLGRMLLEKGAKKAEVPRGWKLLRQAIVRGSDLAATELAYRIEHGETDLPPELGVMLASGAAAGGIADAWGALGLASERGRGALKNPEQALAYFQQGVAAGSGECSYFLGMAHATGTCGPRNPAVAYSHFEKAAERGSPRGMVEAGRSLLFGNGVKANHTKALAWLRRAEAARAQEARELLAIALLNGWGVPADPEGAAKRFAALAEEGSLEAMNHLANCLLSGTGLRKNPERAVTWMKKSAAQGNAPAAFALVAVYDAGTGAPRNKDESWKWLQRAADLGHAEACMRVGVAHHQGQFGPPSMTESFRWYQRAAELGSPIATNNVGACYQFGHGVEVDAKRAFEFYSRAAEMGVPMSLLNVSLCYERGFGVSVDLEKARAFRARALAAEEAARAAAASAPKTP